MKNDIFEAFNKGNLNTGTLKIDFDSIPWTEHPKFAKVLMKRLIGAKESKGKFSLHLIQIAPNASIGLHKHDSQLEIHEVISGQAVCDSEGIEIEYFPGVINFIEAKIEHQVKAGAKGVKLFAKFIPALN